MRSKVPFVLGFGIVTAFLSSCSLMGSRQESTKKDLEGNNISQLKIHTSPVKKANPDDPNAATANDTSKIGLDTRFLPSLDVKKYVQDKKINLKQIIGEEELPKDLNRAFLFFGLDGKISGTLNVKSGPDDRFIEQTGYDEAVASGKKDELVAKDPTCEGNIEDIFAEGSAKFDLSQTQLDDLARNTIREDGTNAREELVKEVQKAKSNNNPDAVVDVTSIVFNDLSESTQKGIKALFKPDVGLLLLLKAYYMQVCYSPTGKHSAFVSDSDGYRYIPSSSIKTEQVNGKLKLEIQETKKITEEKMRKSNFVLKNSDENIPFETLTFGEGIPVFTNTECNEVTNYTLYHDVPKQSVAEKPTDLTNPQTDPIVDDQKEVVPASNTQTPDVNTVTAPLPATDNSQSTSPSAATTTVTNNSNEPFKLKDKPVTPHQSNQNTSTTKKVEVPEALQTNEEYQASQKDNATKKTSENVSKNSEKKGTPPQAIAAIPAVVTAFTKSPGLPVWFNPQLNGHSKQFYREEGKNVAYDPGDKNFKFWDLAPFQKASFTDEEVNAKCAEYKYSRTLEFTAHVNPPSEVTKEKYFTFSNGASKSYADVLFDQFSTDGNGNDNVVKALVQASLYTPPGIDKQNWKIKIGFGDDGKFTAFLTSDELRATSYHLKEDGHTVVLDGSAKRHWREISLKDQFAGPIPEGFNSNRKKYNLSSFSIDCSKGPNNCVALFQLDFKRLITADILLAYLNRKKLDESYVYFLAPKKVLSGIRESFTKHPNKNEVVVYGGFNFNPAEVGEVQAKFESQIDLTAQGYFFANSDVKAHIIFPGENSELYLRIN